MIYIRNFYQREKSDMKKIVIASRIYAPEPAAAAFRLRSLAKSLFELNCDIQVVTTVYNKQKDKYIDNEDKDIDVSRWWALRNKQGNIKGYINYMSFDIPLIIRLLFIKTPNAYICEPPATTAIIVNCIARMHKKPWVYYAADVWSVAAKSFGAPKIVTILLQKLEKKMLNSSHLVLTVSKDMACKLEEIGVDKEKIKIVNNGVDMKIFNPKAPIPKHYLADTEYFVYAGTLSGWQGVDIFIEALPKVIKKYPNINILILGQGDHENKLRKIAQKIAPSNIHFLGIKAGEEASSWIVHAKAALVSVNPKSGYNIAQPTKIFAASACGTPVIYAGSDAGSEVVKINNLGIAVQYSSDEVSQTMIDLLDKPWRNKRILSQWAEKNASLEKVSIDAAKAILDLIE